MRRSVAAARASATLSYSEAERRYHQAVNTARSLPRARLSEDTVIVSTYDAIPPARILYTNCLHAGLRCSLLEPSYASVSLIPYRETGNIIVFTRNPRSLRVVNLAEASSLLGLEVTVVTPPPHPAVRERLESVGAEVIEVEEPSLLVMSIASALWTPKLMGAREERVRAELEDLPSALRWVEEKMRVRLSSLREVNPRPPLYTPIAAPGAYYHCLALRCGAPLPVEAVLSVDLEPSIIYLSSVELHDYRDLLTIPKKGIDKGLIVEVNADPVTAGLYSVLAAVLITGMMI